MNLYMQQTVRVRINNELTEPKGIGRGVRQGCYLSAVMFHI